MSVMGIIAMLFCMVLIVLGLASDVQARINYYPNTMSYLSQKKQRAPSPPSPANPQGSPGGIENELFIEHMISTLRLRTNLDQDGRRFRGGVGQNGSTCASAASSPSLSSPSPPLNPPPSSILQILPHLLLRANPKILTM